MNTFIQVRDGVPYEHPLMMDNMRALFPNHDLLTAPEGFAKFTRGAVPTLGTYKKMDESKGHSGCGCTYEPTSDGYEDVWHIVDMTPTEKADKISDTPKPLFYDSFTFDEPTCSWNPPVAYPVDISDPDAAIYAWKDSDTSWVEITTTRPENGAYYFNVNTATWTEVPTAPSETGYVFNHQTGAWVDE